MRVVLKNVCKDIKGARVLDNVIPEQTMDFL